MDWNDLQAFAAVLRHGSTAKAAKALGVEQTTCARRIAALEKTLGLSLFARTQAGYRPTDSALELASAAEALLVSAENLTRAVEAERRRSRKEIRVTTEEILARSVVAPAVARFSAAYPDVQVAIDVATNLRDLNAGEADIAVRSGPAPTDETLVRRRLGHQPWAVYCGRSYAQCVAPPRNWAQVYSHPFAAVEGVFRETAESGGLDVRHVVTNFAALAAVLESGRCVGAMPRALGDASPGLELCFDFELPESQSWLVYPERLRHNPLVQALGKLIGEEFRRSYRP